MSKRSTFRMGQTERRLAIIQGSHRLETLEPPERPSVLRGFPQRDATVFSFPVDAESQHP